MVSRTAANDDASPASLTLDITMAMGNCPKYLHVRDLIGEEQAPLTPIIEVSFAEVCRQVSCEYFVGTRNLLYLVASAHL